MKRVGLSELRKMNKSYLRKLTEPLEICGRDLKPIRVLLPYQTYMEMQELLLSAARSERRGK